jgi:hypothetical protein
VLVLVFLKRNFIARLCSKCPTPEGSDFVSSFFHGGQSWMPCNFFPLENKCPIPEGSDICFLVSRGTEGDAMRFRLIRGYTC